jgi:hypothetical protein
MKRTLLWLLVLLFGLAVTLGLIRSRAARIGSAVFPEIVAFTATPRVISPGESATLAWETRGVVTVAMSWGPENNPRGNMQRRTGLPPVGMMIVRPGEDTVYVLECETDAGEVCMSAGATVRVKRTHP